MAIPQFGTIAETNPAAAQLALSTRETDKKRRAECINSGGTWDDVTKTCNITTDTTDPTKIKLPPKEPEKPLTGDTKINTPEFIRDEETGNISGIKLPDGRTFLGIGLDEVNALAQQSLAERTPPAGTVPAGTARRGEEQAALGQQLAGQVGQIDPSTGITPTDVDVGQALTQGVVGSIPGAIRLAAQAGVGAAAIGAVATAPVGGIGAAPAAAIGAVAGFVAGIVGGITSDMNSQRTDNTNAQQRVLDEGKQTLMDWVTLSKADPTNRGHYLSEFNRQLQLIQDAHVQMLTDTNADIGKFESAIPNLAEFSTFYSTGGERDALLNEMVIALQTPSSVEYDMLALANRRQS